MSVIHVLALHVFHLVYALLLRIDSLKKRYFASPPQQLSATRRRVPKHLAIVFAINPSIPAELSREALTESVVNAVGWCRTIGIKKLTVYEEHDTLSKCTQALYERLPVQENEVDCSESEVDYPLTPPPSDHSESRPISPSDIPRSCTPITKLRISGKLTQKRPQKEQQKLSKRRQQFHGQKLSPNSPKSDLFLCMISAEASKPAIAAVAQALAEKERRRVDRDAARHYKLSVEDLDQILEDEDGLSSPDFMIIHPLDTSYSSLAPPELHGFPPWHIRLTEIFLNYPRDSRTQSLFNWRRSSLPIPLDEFGFREALDEYASAEMRFGK